MPTVPVKSRMFVIVMIESKHIESNSKLQILSSQIQFPSPRGDTKKYTLLSPFVSLVQPYTRLILLVKCVVKVMAEKKQKVSVNSLD